MANEITLSKGGTTVIIYSNTIADNYTNTLFVIKSATSPANQASGPTVNKVVDLLRVVHQIIIKGYITGTASATALSVKQDLVNIWKGAASAGGTVSLTYDSNAQASGDTTATDTNPISGFIEKVTFVEDAFDEPDDFASAKENYQNVLQFQVAITFVEGSTV